MALAKKSSDYRAKGLGDCIDCSQCVQVCPTGIDIRDGLQMECIGCAACIDICDGVMDKMGYPRGLIRYATEHSVAHKKTNILRPRLITYGIVLSLITVLFLYLLIERVPLQLDVIRDRTHIYRETSEGLIKNSYILKVMNMSQRVMHYQIELVSPNNINYLGQKILTVEPGKIISIPVALTIDPDAIKQRNTTVIFRVQSRNEKGVVVNTESRFIGPIDD